MSRVLQLIFQGSVALFSEAGRMIAHGVARFEREWMTRLASLPAAALETCALFVRATLKGSGEDLFVFAFSIILLILFLLLR